MKADEEALALFKNFRKIQLTLQEKQMAGEELEAEELEYAQKTAPACTSKSENNGHA